MSGYTKPLIHLEFNDTDKTVWNNGLGNESSNTSFGDGALRVNTTGLSNTAFGTESLNQNTEGQANTALGYTALWKNTVGYENTAVGDSAMEQNTEGLYNTANGARSLQYNTTGDRNTSLGAYALQINDTGSQNTALGNESGTYLHNGSGQNSTPENSIFIGVESRALTNNDTNQIVIGYQAEGNGSNTVVLGNDDITETYLKGVSSIGITTDYADNAAALSGGLVVGQVYRTADVLKIVH